MFLKKSFEKVNFEKKSADDKSMKNYTVRLIVNCNLESRGMKRNILLQSIFDFNLGWENTNLDEILVKYVLN